jgi:hypothetical protein
MAIQQTSVDFFAIAETPAHNRDESMIDLDTVTVACRGYFDSIDIIMANTELYSATPQQ